MGPLGTLQTPGVMCQLHPSLLELGLTRQQAVTKYKAVLEIVNAAISFLFAKCSQHQFHQNILYIRWIWITPVTMALQPAMFGAGTWQFFLNSGCFNHKGLVTFFFILSFFSLLLLFISFCFSSSTSSTISSSSRLLQYLFVWEHSDLWPLAKVERQKIELY